MSTFSSIIYESIHFTTFPLILRTISTFFFLLFCFCTVKAQLPSGVWVSSHELRVGNYLDPADLDERMMRMMRTYFLEDSVYSEGGLILDIDSTGTARMLRDIRSVFIENAYQPEDEKLAFGQNIFRPKQMSDSSFMLVRQMMDSIKFEDYFHRLPDSDLLKDATKFSIPVPGAHLQLSVSDTLDRNYQLDFIDERQLVITGVKDEMPFTTRGTWHSRWVGNKLLFSFFDNHFDQMQLYSFYRDSANVLVGTSFNNAKVLDAEPPKLRAALIKAEVPDSARLASLKHDIVGAWTATNEPLFYDPAIEFGFLSYQSFEIDLAADGSFEMMKSGTILKHGDAIPLEETTEGEWEIGPTGRYLILTPIDDVPFYFSIEKVTSQELDVHYFMKTLSEFPSYNVFENRRVEFRR